MTGTAIGERMGDVSVEADGKMADVRNVSRLCVGDGYIPDI